SRWRECQKPRGGRQRRQDQTTPRMVRICNEGWCQLVALEALGPVTDAELQAEVHADPDKKHKEGHRYGVVGADHGETQRGRYREPNEESDKDRKDNPGRPKREPKDDEN